MVRGGLAIGRQAACIVVAAEGLGDPLLHHQNDRFVGEPAQELRPIPGELHVG
jgi:hypothetical protein